MYINKIVCHFTCDIGSVTRTTKTPGITYAPELIVALGVEIMFPTSTSSTWLYGIRCLVKFVTKLSQKMLQSRRSQRPPSTFYR